jgi:hypothetical protein
MEWTTTISWTEVVMAASTDTIRSRQFDWYTIHHLTTIDYLCPVDCLVPIDSIRGLPWCVPYSE